MQIHWLEIPQYSITQTVIDINLKLINSNKTVHVY